MIRVQWAAAWIDRAERTRMQIDEMVDGMIVKQLIVPVEDAEILAYDILRLIRGPQ